MLVHTFVKYMTLSSRLCITCPLAQARLVTVENLGYVNKHPTTSTGLHMDTGSEDVMQTSEAVGTGRNVGHPNFKNVAAPLLQLNTSRVLV